MTIEAWILLGVYVFTAALLFAIPREKIRLAVVAFLFKQFITFLIGLVVVEWGLLEYPVRLFPSVSRSSFTYEFFAYPLTCAIFNVWYPNNRNLLIQFMYYVAFTTVLTIGEVIIEIYTDLITYIHWEWYISWISICLTFYMTRRFCIWFFAKEHGEIY
ncbi:CBO0543 family protein [Bacillus nitroreducens]